MRLVLPEQRRFHLTRVWLLPALLGGVVTVLVSAGAAAALETNTVSSYWRGLWWAVGLITTVGFIGETPETVTGAVLSAVLMIVGFLLLAMVSASLAALFVREEEQPREVREQEADAAVLEALVALQERFDRLEETVRRRSAADPGPAPAGRETGVRRAAAPPTDAAAPD